MFSLHKNYIKEQQNLIHQLQEQIIQQNIKLKELGICFEYKQQIIPFFKKIAQILAYYCSENVKLKNCPDGSTAANLMLLILDRLEDEMNIDKINEIETKIRNWEADIIEKTNAAIYEIDKNTKDSSGIVANNLLNSKEFSENANDVSSTLISNSDYEIEQYDEIKFEQEDKSIADDVLDNLVSQMKEDEVFSGAFDDEPEIIVSENGKISSKLAEKESSKSVEATLDTIELQMPSSVKKDAFKAESVAFKNDSKLTKSEVSSTEKKIVANFGGLLLVESD